MVEALDTVPVEERARLEQTWVLLQSLPLPEPILDNTRLRRIETVLERELQHRPSAPPKRLRRFVGWSVATAAVIGFIIALFQPHVIQVPAGETYTLDLPDGSRIELNGGSQIAYRPLFGTLHRRVALSGEGFFDVQQDQQAFIVQTPNAAVTVLGTRFNVRAEQTASGVLTSVTLEEGRVELRSDAGSVVLEPGQRSSVGAAEPTPPESADFQTALAWRPKTLAFIDIPLADIFDEIVRSYNVRIDTIDLPDRSLTYRSPQPLGAAALIQEICQTARLTCRSTGTGFLVQPPLN